MFELFKGDTTEIKMHDAGEVPVENISISLDEYFAGIYECVPLGKFLYDEKRVSLTNAIKRDIFITSFKEIFDAWEHCGTFESYILVLKKIFGESATIAFTVPSAGILEIAVGSTGYQEDFFVVRSIVDNAYVFDNVITTDGDNIVFNVVKGFQTQQELEAALYFLVPNGIYTTVNLTIGA